jgi:hypothetical protein
MCNIYSEEDLKEPRSNLASEKFSVSPISHVRWNDQLMVNRIAHWAKNISHGKEDIRQTMIGAEFIEGGTVGRVKK